MKRNTLTALVLSSIMAMGMSGCNDDKSGDGAYPPKVEYLSLLVREKPHTAEFDAIPLGESITVEYTKEGFVIEEVKIEDSYDEYSFMFDDTKEKIVTTLKYQKSPLFCSLTREDFIFRCNGSSWQYSHTSIDNPGTFRDYDCDNIVEVLETSLTSGCVRDRKDEPRMSDPYDTIEGYCPAVPDSMKRRSHFSMADYEFEWQKIHLHFDEHLQEFNRRQQEFP